MRPHSPGWRRDADFVSDYGRAPRAQRRLSNDRKHDNGGKAEIDSVAVFTKPHSARECPRNHAAIEDGGNDDQADDALAKHSCRDYEAEKRAGQRMPEDRDDAELKRSPNPCGGKPDAERDEQEARQPYGRGRFW